MKSLGRSSYDRAATVRRSSSSDERDHLVARHERSSPKTLLRCSRLTQLPQSGSVRPASRDILLQESMFTFHGDGNLHRRFLPQLIDV